MDHFHASFPLLLSRRATQLLLPSGGRTSPQSGAPPDRSYLLLTSAFTSLTFSKHSPNSSSAHRLQTSCRPGIYLLPIDTSPVASRQLEHGTLTYSSHSTAVLLCRPHYHSPHAHYLFPSRISPRLSFAPGNLTQATLVDRFEVWPAA